MRKRIISMFTALLMVFSLAVVMPSMEVSAASFTPRTTAPTSSNAYYYSLNPFYKSGYGMPNCTAYAYGRAYEILGSKPNLSTGNAGQWWWKNKSTGAYSYGSTPKLGAIACWDKYDQNQGHVAVVEAINGSYVTISESHYKSTFFDTRTINSNSSNYLTSMRFLGYIYIGDFSSSPPILPGAIDNSYDVPTNVTATHKISTYDEYGNVESGRYIASGDNCYISEVYTNGFVKVRYPTSSGDRWSYAKRDDFDIPRLDPLYSNFWLTYKDTSYTKYKLGDTIEVNVDAHNYTCLTVGIDKEGVGRVVTKEIDSHYEFSTYDLGPGSYSIYVTVSGSNSHVDTNTLWFSINKPFYTNFSASKSVYLLGEKIGINTDGGYYDKLVLGIDKDGIGRVCTKEITSYCEIPTKDLGVGSYSAYVSLYNLHGEYVDTNRIWFKIAEPLYLGDDFNAMIINTHSQKPIMQDDNNNVVLGSENLNNYDKTIWHFVRNADETYTIYSYKNNKCLDVQNCDDKAGANVHCLQKHDETDSSVIAQHWYIFKFDDGNLYLKPKCSTNVLELENGSEEDNTNVHLYKINDSNAQKFTVKRVNAEQDLLNYKINVNKDTCSINEKVNITINGNINYVYNYKFHIIDPSGKETIVDNKCNSTYSFIGNKPGKYVIFAEIKNPLYTEIGSKSKKYVTINVSCPHNYGTWTTTKAATCTADGNQTRKCSVCGKTETKTIAKTGHTVVIDKAAAATCTASGKTEGSHCSKCGTVIKAQTTIPAKGHTFGSWATTKAATCTADGNQTRKCSVCGKTETKTIAKTGHKYTTKVVAPTATSQGYTLHTCSVCGDSYKDNYTDCVKTEKPLITGLIDVSGIETTEHIDFEIRKTDSEEVVFVGEFVEGAYSIPILSAGKYTVTASQENCAPRTYNITVGDKPIELDVELHLYGDVNADGKVTVSDVAKVNSHVKKKAELTGYDFAVADVNKDVKLSVSDSAKINAHMKGKSLLW